MVTQSGLKVCVSLAQMDLNSELLLDMSLTIFRAPNIRTLQVTYLRHPSLRAPQSSLPMKATAQAGLKICRSSLSPGLRVVPRPISQFPMRCCSCLC